MRVRQLRLRVRTARPASDAIASELADASAQSGFACSAARNDRLRVVVSSLRAREQAPPRSSPHSTADGSVFAALGDQSWIALVAVCRLRAPPATELKPLLRALFLAPASLRERRQRAQGRAPPSGRAGDLGPSSANCRRPTLSAVSLTSPPAQASEADQSDRYQRCDLIPSEPIRGLPTPR